MVSGTMSSWLGLLMAALMLSSLMINSGRYHQPAQVLLLGCFQGMTPQYQYRRDKVVTPEQKVLNKSFPPFLTNISVVMLPSGYNIICVAIGRLQHICIPQLLCPWHATANKVIDSQVSQSEKNKKWAYPRLWPSPDQHPEAAHGCRGSGRSSATPRAPH